jgi:hypothetical protein
MRSSQTFAIAILLSFACGGYAFGHNQSPGLGGWIEVGSNGTTTRYIDKATVFHKGKYGIIWRLQDFHTDNYVDNKMFRSVKYQVEYDCISHERRGLYYEIYSGQMATGRLVDFSYALDRWRPVPSDGGLGLEVACGSNQSQSVRPQ